MMQKHELLVRTAYHQFFILDDEDQNDAMAIIADVTDSDLHTRIKVSDEIVVVHTERDGKSKLVIEVHDEVPMVNLHDWDHVVEGGIHFPSSRMQVCTLNRSSAYAHIELAFHDYRIRVHQGKLATVVDPDARDGEDYYLLTLWPSSDRSLVVRKQYEPSC